VIRLIHAGETMIPQGLAKQLFERLSNPATAGTPSAVSAQTSWSQEYGITDREFEVLQCLADKLYLSEGSVRNYISSVYSKLNVQNRASAIRKFHYGE
jgi:DNA-binding NarL/FixJ family response regulator